MLKLVDGDERGAREAAFYETVFASEDQEVLRLKRWVSVYPRSCV